MPCGGSTIVKSTKTNEFACVCVCSFKWMMFQRARIIKIETKNETKIRGNTLFTFMQRKLCIHSVYVFVRACGCLRQTISLHRTVKNSSKSTHILYSARSKAHKHTYTYVYKTFSYQTSRCISVQQKNNRKKKNKNNRKTATLGRRACVYVCDECVVLLMVC